MVSCAVFSLGLHNQSWALVVALNIFIMKNDMFYVLLNEFDWC